MTYATHLGLRAALLILSALASTPVPEHAGAQAIAGEARISIIKAHADILSDIDRRAEADSAGDTSSRLMRTGKQALAEDTEGADLSPPDDEDDEDKAHHEKAKKEKKSWTSAGWEAAAKTGAVNEPVDCKLGNWEQWEPCTVTCGTGDTQRKRKGKRGIVQMAKHGGRSCSPNAHRAQTKTCGTELCPTTTTVAAAKRNAAASPEDPEAKSPKAAPEAAAAAPAKKSNALLYGGIGGAIGLVAIGGAAFAMQNQKPKQQLDENGDPIEVVAYDDAGDLDDYQEDQY